MGVGELFEAVRLLRDLEGFWLDTEGQLHEVSDSHEVWARDRLGISRMNPAFGYADSCDRLFAMGWFRGVVAAHPLGYISVNGEFALNHRQRAALEELGMERDMPVKLTVFRHGEDFISREEVVYGEVPIPYQESRAARLLEYLNFDTFFRISEPKRIARSATVRGPPLDISAHKDEAYYWFNFRAHPSTGAATGVTSGSSGPGTATLRSRSSTARSTATARTIGTGGPGPTSSAAPAASAPSLSTRPGTGRPGSRTRPGAPACASIS
jgi:hypothetical protein